jgi:hypothetical protein
LHSEEVILTETQHALLEEQLRQSAQDIEVANQELDLVVQESNYDAYSLSLSLSLTRTLPLDTQAKEMQLKTLFQRRFVALVVPFLMIFRYVKWLVDQQRDKVSPLPVPPVKHPSAQSAAAALQASAAASAPPASPSSSSTPTPAPVSTSISAPSAVSSPKGKKPGAISVIFDKTQDSFVSWNYRSVTSCS